MMSLNSMFMLNYPLGLTLIQSSLKALKGGVIEGFNTHVHTQPIIHTRIHINMNAYRHTTKEGCFFSELQQLRNQFVKGAQLLSSKTNLQTDFLCTFRPHCSGGRSVMHATLHESRINEMVR